MAASTKTTPTTAFVLGFSLILGGCASVPSRVRTVSDWHAVQSASAMVIESQAVNATGKAATVRISCSKQQPLNNVAELTLSVVTNATASSSTGTLKFGENPAIQTTWQPEAQQLTAQVSADRLADGLTDVFKSHEPVVVSGVPGFSTPITFTVGQGPYESTSGDFFADCSDTASRMPQLVRIRNARLIPEPSNPGLSRVQYGTPGYPGRALRERMTGVVRVVASVDAQGQVLWPEVVRSSGYDLLDQTAKTALASSRYQQSNIGPNTLYIVHQDYYFHMPSKGISAGSSLYPHSD